MLELIYNQKIDHLISVARGVARVVDTLWSEGLSANRWFSHLPTHILTETQTTHM